MDNCLNIIDGNSLLYRAFFALPPLTNPQGQPVNAIYGFMNMLIKLAEDNPAPYLAVAFDVGKTFRHDTYADYKAGRQETPDELRSQFPLCKVLLSEMGIAIVEGGGYEADDYLGSYAASAEKQGWRCNIITGDRDALQLISEHTTVLLTQKGLSLVARFDPAYLWEVYQLKPEQMVDLKGLMGDHSDNLPGVPGVGEKTALKLLWQFGSLEKVYEHTDQVKGDKLRENLLAHRDSAWMCRQLGTIDCAAALPVALEGCLAPDLKGEKAIQALYRMGFTSIVKRLSGSDAVPPIKRDAAHQAGIPLRPALQLASLEYQEESLQSPQQLQEKMRAFKGNWVAILPGETVTIALDEHTQYKLNTAHTLLESSMDIGAVIEVLQPILNSPGILIITRDAKLLYHMLGQAYPVWDTLLADYLLGEDTHNPLHQAACMQHALFQVQEENLRDQGMLVLYQQVELPLSAVLYRMERAGIAVDTAALQSLSSQFALQLDALTAQIHQLAGASFNLNSPKQLGSILFEKLGLPIAKKTKTGYSTDAEVLENLAHQHPIIPTLLEYRQLAKLKSTYVDGLLAAIGHDGRVHTLYQQAVTATGRLSSTEPNLQSIPVRTPQGRVIRKAFVSKPGWVLLDADYSQIELRILAHLSEDQALIRAFQNREDIHTHTASLIAGVPDEEVTGEMRSRAKAVNFGIIYGISDFGLARDTRLSRKEAKDFIERYLQSYPGVAAYMEHAIAMAQERGYAATPAGRRRWLPELRSHRRPEREFGKRVALNMPIQGMSADIIKRAMVEIDRRLAEEGLATRILLQVHDELLLEAPLEEAERVAQLLEEAMTSAANLKVPLVAEVSMGESWYDAKA